MSLDVQGVTTLEAALQALPLEVAGPILTTALAAAGEVVRKDVQARIRERTGRTGRDLRVVVTTRAGDLSGKVAIGADDRGKRGRFHILRFLEFGTKPHEILPKRRRAGRRKKALAFAGIVRTRVMHPGIAAQAPLRTAFAQKGPLAIKVFAEVAWAGIRAAAERLGRRGV